MPYIMLPSGKQVRVDSRGRPVKKEPARIICSHCHAECGAVVLKLNARSYCSAECRELDGESLAAAMRPRALATPVIQLPEEPPPTPVAPRRFCGCGQEAWPRNGSVPLDYDGSPICNDCSADRARVLLGDPGPEPLSERIRDAQPDVEEHAFERPGYSWP